MEYLIGISCVLFPIGIVGFLVYAHVQRWQAVNEADRDYRSSLEQLKMNPTDPNLKQQTLSLGRRYLEISRDRGGTEFDEIALSNDINAACAASFERVRGIVKLDSSAPSSTSGGTSVEERLTKLKGLYDKGMISSDEYAEKRKKLIDEM